MVLLSKTISSGNLTELNKVNHVKGTDVVPERDRWTGTKREREKKREKEREEREREKRERD